MRIGCCGGADSVQLYSNLGFDYIEPSVISVIEDENYDLLLKKVEKFSLKAEVFNCFMPSSLPIVGPNVDYQAIDKYLTHIFPRIRGVGGEIVVFGSGKARKIPQDFCRKDAGKQILIFLEMAMEKADDKIQIVIEPLNKNQTNFLNFVAETRELCEKLDWRVGLLADLFHMVLEKEPLEKLMPVFQLGHIHIPMPEAAFPVINFLQILKSGGYQNRISLEDNGGLLGRIPLGKQYEVFLETLAYIKSLI